MVYTSSFKYDIYVSYSEDDNEPAPGEREGWVDVFLNQLTSLLDSRLGQPGLVSITRANAIDRATGLMARTGFDIEASALFLTLISESYLRSRRCNDELKIFTKAANSSPHGLSPGNLIRVFNVWQEDIPRQKLPRELSTLGETAGYEFFDGESGARLDYKDKVGFYHRLDELASYIIYALDMMRVNVKAAQSCLPATSEAPRPADAGAEIFVSFKDLGDDGRETRDCAIARDVTKFLREQGFSVFFSRDSLETVGTSAFKRAIDDALERSTVMIVVGTSPENLLSGWVRYEWDGFLQDLIEGVKPHGEVFTVVENMAPRDLPRGLRQRQVFKNSADELSRMVNFIRGTLNRRDA